MPRRARLSLAGIPWHNIQHGNSRPVCFLAAEDYRFGFVIHASVLMTNHAHLLLNREKRDSAALLGKHPGRGYVQ